VAFVDAQAIAAEAHGWRLVGVRPNVAGICPACLSEDDPDLAIRRERVEDLCRSLNALVALSEEQRRQFDQIVGQLEELTEQARQIPQAKADVKGSVVR
jgi:hypothetical protein